MLYCSTDFSAYIRLQHLPQSINSGSAHPVSCSSVKSSPREGFDPSQQVYQRERAAFGRSCFLHGETAFLPRGDDAENKRRMINMYIAISRFFGSRSRPEYISHKDVSLSKGFVRSISCHGRRIILLRSLFYHGRTPARPAKPQSNGLSISLPFCVLYHGL